MTDLCTGLLILAVILVVIIPVGHWLWVLCAYLFRAMFDIDSPGSQQRKARPVGERCPRCRSSIPLLEYYCRRCGLDCNGLEAAELRNLEATARQIQALRDSGTLDPASCEQFYAAVEARQRALLGDVAPDPARQAPRMVARIVKDTATPAQRSQEDVLDVLPVDQGSAVVPLAELEDAAVSTSTSGTGVAPAVPPKPPRPSLAEMLAGFMEERNILWVHLIVGLLVVGCSIALVISLWDRLQGIHYFPFFIFAGFTTAFFGAGLYTLRYWKLESTSQGILVIASLLVPLNFLVMAGLTVDNPGWLEMVLDCACVAVFAGLMYLTAHPGSECGLVAGPGGSGSVDH